MIYSLSLLSIKGVTVTEISVVKKKEGKIEKGKSKIDI